MGTIHELGSVRAVQVSLRDRVCPDAMLEEAVFRTVERLLPTAVFRAEVSCLIQAFQKEECCIPLVSFEKNHAPRSIFLYKSKAQEWT